MATWPANRDVQKMADLIVPENAKDDVEVRSRLIDRFYEIENRVIQLISRIQDAEKRLELHSQELETLRKEVGI